MYLYDSYIKYSFSAKNSILLPNMKFEIKEFSKVPPVKFIQNNIYKVIF
jgi:hypothetical protein